MDNIKKTKFFDKNIIKNLEKNLFFKYLIKTINNNPKIK